MKITELKCKACNGTLKIEEDHPNQAVCEYCKTRYTVEWEVPQGQYDSEPEVKQMISNPVTHTISAKQVKQSTGWVVGVSILLVATCIFFFCIFIGTNFYTTDSSITNPGTYSLNVEEEKAVYPEGILADFAEEVFGKPIEEITEDDLSKIKWMESTTSFETFDIGYSFEDPAENPEAELTWLSFPKDYRNTLSNIAIFTGLKKISVNQEFEGEELYGLKLTSITGHYSSLEEVASLLEYPEELKELNMSESTVSLTGMEQLPNLEILRITSTVITEEKELVHGKNLKSLTLDMHDGTMNFSALSVMQELEELTLIADGIRDVSFIFGMNSLKSLSIERGTFLNLDGLAARPELESLSIQNCTQLADMSAVGELHQLTDLTLEIPHNCAEPDLSNLSNLQTLYLEGAAQTGFLKNLSNLTTLTLYGCTVSSASDFAGLTNLKNLTCGSFVQLEKDYSFIPYLTALENLDLHGTATYEDISGIMNLPMLKTLNLNDIQCEIDFNKLNDNSNLEKLSMDGVKLYKNVSVTNDGLIQYVDWDNVDFNENIQFLGKFHGLKELSIKENKVTDLNFVTTLESLEILDFTDNYVTDLSPLVGLRALKEVYCAQNPIINDKILSESVMVVGDGGVSE